MIKLKWIVLILTISFINHCFLVAKDNKKGGATFSRTLKESTLILREGVVGGIIAPQLRNEISLFYDYDSKNYILTKITRKENGTYNHEIGTVDEKYFTSIFEKIKEEGLLDLPLENPTGGKDIYNLDKSIGFFYKSDQWLNRAPSGCIHRESSITPSEKEIKIFKKIVAYIESLPDTLKLIPVDKKDFPRPVITR